MNIKKIFSVTLFLASIPMAVWGLDFLGVISMTLSIPLILLGIGVIIIIFWLFFGIHLFDPYPYEKEEGDDGALAVWLFVTILVLLILSGKTFIIAASASAIIAIVFYLKKIAFGRK